MIVFNYGLALLFESCLEQPITHYMRLDSGLWVSFVSFFLCSDTVTGMEAFDLAVPIPKSHNCIYHDIMKEG
jgi:hypothetical protein